MKSYICFLLIVLLTALLPSAADARGVRGWFEEGCEGFTVHLSLRGGALSGQQLILQLETGLPPGPLLAAGGKWEFEGEICPSSGQCRKATRAHVWLKPLKMKTVHLFGVYYLGFGGNHLSGEYNVDVAGQHLEGRFRAKLRKPKHMLICE